MNTNNTNTVSLIIPYDGFYHGVVDSLLDMEIESYIEYLKEQEPSYDDYPDYSIDWLEIAKRYVINYKKWLACEHSIELALDFEELIMPKEYNFTTDRIFCTVPLKDLESLHAAFIANDNNQDIVNDTFKNRDGFISFYTGFVDNWQLKPLNDWDHNELSILLPEPENFYELWEDDLGNGFFYNVITYKESI